jgi:nucleoside-diphosphate-sugar epimerase
MIAERVFLSFKDKIDITCIRPATVCGLSERLRLDLTVNKLTYDAFYKKKIFVDGGSQIRPNIHIKDLISAIDYLVFRKKKFNHNIYNVGFENLMISEIANKIQNKIDAKIVVNKNRDIRSYRQDSSRLLKSGFKPKYSIDFAIDELINFFQTKSKFNFTNKNFNLLRMKELNIR